MARRPAHLPPPVPAGRRVFAHVLSADLACPACGTVHAAPGGRARRKRKGESGYNALSGRFRCRVCRRQWVIGVIYWALGAPTAGKRQPDTVPQPSEALQLRGWLAEPDVRACEQRVNRVADGLEDPPGE